MATIRKGQRNGFRNMRIAITADYPQGGDLDGRNLLMVVANDRVNDEVEMTPENVITNPPLVRREGVKENGEKFTSFTVGVSKKQYQDIMAVANTDGDKPVFHANLMPAKDKDGKVIGLIPNTKQLGEKPKEPFNYELHKENTEIGREFRKAQREAASAKEQQAPAPEKQAEDSLEP